MKTRIFAACAVALVSVAALAANLGKYRNWPSTPQGYFMTRADRVQWLSLQSESEAEQFIAKFVASRGAGFEADVAERVKAVDDHLSVGGDIGSRTLRGRIVILLGPPSSFSIAEKQSKDHTASAGAPMSGAASSGNASRLGSGGGAVGLAPSDIADANIANDMSARLVHIYNFTYAKDRLPGKQAKDLVISVEVNPSNGEDRIVDTRVARQVIELLEAAAEARATAGPAKQ